MAFVLRKTESVAHGLRRLAAKELRSARKRLGQKTSRSADHPGDTGVHEARKSIKKVRAILQLIEADGGKGLGRSRQRLRAVARELSKLRDADATLKILGKLRGRNRGLVNEHAFARLQREVAARKRQVQEAAKEEHAWKDVDRTLAKLKASAKGWRPARRRFGALERGIRLTHREGRRALARARDRQGAADFHEWRKQMKSLRYQLRLVAESSPVINRAVRALHTAERFLGDEHDLVVLCKNLGKKGSVCEGKIDRDRLQLAADRYQCELRTKAMAEAKDIFRPKPGDFLRMVRRGWRTWRRRKRGSDAAAGERRAKRAA